MRKSLWIFPALLLFAAIGAPRAHADSSYTLDFTCTGSCAGLSQPTVSGTVSFPSPVIDVMDDGTLFALTLAPGDAPSDIYEWYAYDSDGGSTVIEFEIVDVSTTDAELTGVMGHPPEVYNEGTLTFVATPEPSSLSLTLFGVVLLGLMMAMLRKNSKTVIT